MVKRYENWPMLLSQFLQEQANKPFEWGENDCLIYTSKGIGAITGFYPAENFPKYTTEEGAEEILKKNGGIVRLMEKALGRGSDKVLTARRGDAALVKVPALTGGIVDDSGRYISVVTQRDGLRRIPLEKAYRIWSI